jgi:hypothetical protein
MRDLLIACVDAWTELAQLVEEASEVQFMPSPIPRPAEDTTERAQGGHSDPTSRIVADARRIAVREFVLDSIRAASKLKRQGEHALDRWAGLA